MIVMYKLSSGEEIVVNEISSTDTHITVKEAVTLVYQQIDSGRMTVGFAPFMPYCDGNIVLHSSSIVARSHPKDQILQEYNRVFSNIVIAPASTLL